MGRKESEAVTGATVVPKSPSLTLQAWDAQLGRRLRASVRRLGQPRRLGVRFIILSWWVILGSNQ
jgi:hypothetical protein